VLGVQFRCGHEGTAASGVSVADLAQPAAQKLWGQKSRMKQYGITNVVGLSDGRVAVT
jgi:hypothetical protein